MLSHGRIRTWHEGTWMKLPAWGNLELADGILRETVPDGRSLVLWLPTGSGPGLRQWERISSLANAQVLATEGLCVAPAVAIGVSQRLRGVFGKLLGRLRRPNRHRTR